MDSKFFSIINRASSTSSMQQSHNFSEILAENAILRRSYYTSRNRKAGLYSKISPLGSPNISVLPELESWVEKGNKVRVAELQRIIHDFRKRKRFSQALEVCPFIILAVPFLFILRFFFFLNVSLFSGLQVKLCEYGSNYKLYE